MMSVNVDDIRRELSLAEIIVQRDILILNMAEDLRKLIAEKQSAQEAKKEPKV